MHKILLGLLWAAWFFANNAYAQNAYYFPQIANGSDGGGGFKTTFVLFNNGSAAVTVTLVLSDDRGAPLPMTLDGNSNSRFVIQLPAGGTRLLETDGRGSLVSGVAKVTSAADIGVSEILSVDDANGNYLAETGIGYAQPISSFVFPVDTTGSFNTALALLNIGSTDATVTLTLRDSSGRQSGTPVSLTMGANNHFARYICGSGQLFPSAANFQGSLSVQSSEPIASIALRENAFPLSYTTLTLTALPVVSSSGAAFSMSDTISDQAQSTTLAFSGLAMMTGNLDAQSFFPPGKVSDYFGFQYLRDNDPDNMGHNTSFLTRIANNVIYILSDAQLAQLAALANTQQNQIDLYGYQRFPLMKAFRRQLENDIPAGATGLNLNAVKQASRNLYILDGQMSFDRALLYSKIINSMDSTQKAYLDAMKGKGWSSWPDISDDQINDKMRALPQGTSVAVMTYASDIFSWYAGSITADVYFCPERHGTYYGGFYIKDAPAVGHEGYSISEQLTATAGSALSDSSKGYVTADQAAAFSGLVDTQRANLYASPTSNIVMMRTQISTLLRSLLTTTGSTDDIKTQVLALSATYGDLDGEDNYNYATVIAQVYKTMTPDQKTRITALRKSIMSGTYSDGTSFDFSVCATPFLYSSAITDASLLAPYLNNTDSLFFEP